MTADETGIVEPLADDAPARSAIDPDGSLRELAGDCVHCGFCLPACPTYQLWGEEMDSPRGRIHLITQILESGAGTAAAAEHFDRCLGCMACMTACPSGVQYDQLIEAARTWAEEAPAESADGTAGGAAGGQAAAGLPSEARGAGVPIAPLPPRSRRDRAVRAAIFATFPYPARLRAALGPLRIAQLTGLDRMAVRSKLLARLAPEAAAALSVAPARPGTGGSGDGGGFVPVLVVFAGSPVSRLGCRPPASAARLSGCLPAACSRCCSRRSTARPRECSPLRAATSSCRGVRAAAARCPCTAAAGLRRRRSPGRRSTTFERAGVDAVIVNAAGCGSAMKGYGRLLAGDPAWAERAAAFSARVRDFSEFLAELGPVAPRSELGLSVAYHDACHLGHAQRITAQPRQLLTAIPGLTLTEIADAGTCCGSAGIYNLVQPEAAAELGSRKGAAVRATGADLLVSANPGCSLQIAQALTAAGAPMPVAHIAEVLDASIRGRPAQDCSARGDSGLSCGAGCWRRCRPG